MSSPVETFQAEANEHLSKLESALMTLEEDPYNLDLIAEAFRSMHTIKGGAGMVGFDYLSEFTHHVETLFDQLRSGQISLSENLSELLLHSCDFVHELLQSLEPDQEKINKGTILINELQKHNAASLQASQAEQASSEGNASTDKSPDKSPDASPDTIINSHNELEDDLLITSYQILIKPDAATFKQGCDLLPIFRELHELSEPNSYECSVFAHDILSNSEFDAETSYLEYQVALSSQYNQQAIEDVFMFVIDDWDVQIEAQKHTGTTDSSAEFNADTEAVAENTHEAIDDSTVASQNGNTIQSTGQTNTSGTLPSVKEKPQKDQASSDINAAKTAPSIRVPQSKLDYLMDQVGELVIMQASLESFAGQQESPELSGLSEELERLSNNLRDIAFDIRMLPIGSAFSRFKRLVRDTSKDLGKRVKLTTSGADTELDKAVLDKLIDPLIHILRNSIDHGIETPEQRKERGKAETGTVSLKAWHAQGQFFIEISDDGAGLNADTILAKAIDKGLVDENNNLSEKDIFNLIFEAGFSTASKVTDVSGRGVGMDVVRTSIESLQGKVNLSSELNKGTQLRIQLPMTLSIIDGLMVSVADSKFVIPLNLVHECIERENAAQAFNARQSLSESDAFESIATDLAEPSVKQRNENLVCHRDKLIPNISLRKRFELPGEQPQFEQVVIVNTDDGLIGVTVDEVNGNHQTVIRNIGRLYKDIPGVMGASILGNGGIAMILEPSALANTQANYI